MAATVVDTNEISLGGVYYRLGKPIQPVLASIYPQKMLFGDSGRDSNPNASVLSLSSWQGGLGSHKESSTTPLERAWWSTCSLRYKNNLTLPGLATLTAASGVSGTFTVGVIGELSSEIYGAFGTSVRKYNNTTDSWGNSLHTLPAVATDVITVRMENVVYLVFAHTGGYTYTSNGTVFTDDTTDTKYLAYWDDALYGIDNTGALWKSTTIGTETTGQGQLPLPDGYVSGLFVARDSAGDPILYAATKVGLFAHDAANLKWESTELSLPYHSNGGLGTERWRDSIYSPVGLGVYQYINGVNTAVITVVGPDRDDGLPSDKRGTIKQLVGTHNDLLAVLDATTAPGTAMAMYNGSAMGSQQSTVIIDPDVGYSSILGWDSKGWECKWLSGSTARAITWAHVSNAYSTYRLWWALADRVYYMKLAADIINPTQLTDWDYAASAEHITPWFNMGQIEVGKLALRVKVDTTGMSATESVAVEYATDLSESWTALGTITADGVTTYEFPNSTTPTGTAFKWLRFRLSLARGTTTTLTPQVHDITLEHRKKLSVKWSFVATIDLTQLHKGNTPMQLFAALRTAINADVLQEFTYREDSSGDRNYWVDVIPLEGFEFTGHDERGQVTVQLIER